MLSTVQHSIWSIISDVKIKNICAEVFSTCWDVISDVCSQEKIAVITRHRLTTRKDAESFYYRRNKYGSFIAEVASIRRDIL
jgi:phage-related protein